MLLSIQEISKTYKKGKVKALDNLSLELTPGVYGLLGPNGAGKSTLMNIITDSIQPDCGQVLYNGTEISRLGKEFRSVLGYMPQNQRLYESFTAARFLLYVAALKGIPKKQAKQRVEQMLELVNLRDCAHKKLGGFSGGMKQRILIAQALLNDPEVLILDEPTAGLDPKERVRIRNFISRIALEKIVILATHVVSDVEYIAREVLLIDRGHLVMRGTPAKILGDMEGKVWQLHVTPQEIQKVQEQYIVTNILGEKDGLLAVKVVAEKQPDAYSCIPALATLEDVYLSLFDEEKDGDVYAPVPV